MTDPALVDALASSQRLGMLGERPIAEVIEHAGAFVAALAGVTGTVVDLGSGGGVPGLVIATARPDLRLVLVDRRATRTDHLRRLVRRSASADRVDVLTADAAALPGLIAVPVDAVVARGFGPPAETLRRRLPCSPAVGCSSSASRHNRLRIVGRSPWSRRPGSCRSSTTTVASPASGDVSRETGG